MSKYDFRGAKLDNKEGTLAIGEHQTINNVVSKGIEEVSKELREELMKSDIPLEMKKEIQGAIDASEKEAKEEKPNKIVLSSLLGTIEKAITVASATPTLITAFEKWKVFFEPLIG